MASEMPPVPAALDTLYDDLWVYYNLFQPVLRLREKSQAGTRTIRHWDRAQTPLERLLATSCVAQQQRTRLDQLRSALNPRLLRQSIYRDLAALLQQPVEYIVRASA